MSRIRSHGNKRTELVLVKLLRAAGITGWRRQVKLCIPATTRRAGPARPAGDGQTGAGRQARPTRHGGQANIRPDFVFTKQRVAVFVDGCFWHGCRWHCNQPKQNAAFWRQKLDGNKQRDRLVNRTLRRQGWTVVRVWEHELGRTGSQRSVLSNQRVVEKIRRAQRRG